MQQHRELERNTPHTSEERIPMSYEQYCTWEHAGSLVEWVNGEAIIHMPPLDMHQEIAGFLFRLLAQYVEFLHLGRVRIAPFEMRHLPSRASREPDILFVRRENQHRLTRERLEGPADLVVEIVSRDSVTRDRRDKFLEYAQAGVEEYWIVDPRPPRQHVALYHRAAAGGYQEIAPDSQGRSHSVVLSGFWLRPQWLWLEPLPEVQVVLQEIAPRMMNRQTVAVLLRQLARRCGMLDAQTEERIRHLPTAQVAHLAEALLDFDRIDDLHSWLQYHAPPGEAAEQ